MSWSDSHQYLLLGLLDWVCEHPDHTQALLRLGLKGGNGALRKTAAEVGAAMKRTDVLEKVAQVDLDTKVRIRAEKLLQDLKLDELF